MDSAHAVQAAEVQAAEVQAAEVQAAEVLDIEQSTSTRRLGNDYTAAQL